MGGIGIQWITPAALLLAGLGVCPASDIEFVTVGDAGNEPFVEIKTVWGDEGPYVVTNRSGFVAYTYRLGKYELTQAQYLEFLNTVDPLGSNTYGLIATNMVPFPPHESGVDYVVDLSRPEGQRYALANGGADLPAWGITWYSAARFCNWLHNGKGGPGSTEGDATHGAYDTRFFDDGILTNDPPTHNPWARFWIPTFDEWFKAAYYLRGGTNSAAGGWNSGWLGYYDAPFVGGGSAKGGMPTSTPRYSNFYPRLGDQPDQPPCPEKRTPVGSYPGSVSPYGCLDMAGNGNEWSERVELNAWGAATRRTMGGGWWWLTDHPTLYAQLNFSTHLHPPDDWWNGVRIAAAEEIDADRDGMPDAWEVQYFTSTNALNGGAQEDWDGDGMNNLAEYIAGTCPTNPASVFEIVALELEESGASLAFGGVSGRLYRVEYCDNLVFGGWSAMAGSMPGTNGVMRVADPDSPPTRFYRLGVRLP